MAEQSQSIQTHSYLNKRITFSRTKYVIREEKKIVYGKGSMWQDIEADEVDFASSKATVLNVGKRSGM